MRDFFFQKKCEKSIFKEVYYYMCNVQDFPVVRSSTPAVPTSIVSPEKTARCRAGWRITFRDPIMLGFNVVGEGSDDIAGKQTS